MPRHQALWEMYTTVPLSLLPLEATLPRVCLSSGFAPAQNLHPGRSKEPILMSTLPQNLPKIASAVDQRSFLELDPSNTTSPLFKRGHEYNFTPLIWKASKTRSIPPFFSLRPPPQAQRGSSTSIQEIGLSRTSTRKKALSEGNCRSGRTMEGVLLGETTLGRDFFRHRLLLGYPKESRCHN